MKADFEGDPYTFSENLINAQAADYTAFLDTGRFKIASASPELFFKLQDGVLTTKPMAGTDRKSTRLNSSHVATSYAVFCLKQKRKTAVTVPLQSRSRCRQPR